jgi:pimeloyl-ACP methyl ester carboxylesterase
MTEIRERTVSTNGVELHVLEAGEGMPVVLAHGFPELAYSWRHQLPALADAGYRVIAPDQRGYGRSSRPDAIEDYDIEHLTGDLCGLLDELGEERAVFVGHDWGSLVVSSLALLRPDRVAAIVNMSVPFLPRAPMPPVETMRAIFADAFFYIVYFQEPGVADAELSADPAMTMRRLLAGVSLRAGEAPDPSAFANDGRGFVERMAEPDGLPDWLTQDEFDHYVAEFTRTGFTGGINWYRNMDRNWSLTEHIAGATVAVPSLFIGGRLDPVLVMTPPESTVDLLPDHRGTVLVDDAGHWVQQQKPGEVNAALISFLDEVT